MKWINEWMNEYILQITHANSVNCRFYLFIETHMRMYGKFSELLFKQCVGIINPKKEDKEK